MTPVGVHIGGEPDGHKLVELAALSLDEIRDLHLLGWAGTGIAVHWEAAPPRANHNQCAGQVEEIRHYHITHDYSDIAYSFLVCNHGQVFNGRGWDRQSAATCNGSFNSRFWSVCAMTGPGHDSTPEMRRAIRAVVDEARQRGAREVICHRDACATACPGDEICGWVKAGLSIDDHQEPAPPVPEPTRRSKHVIYAINDSDDAYQLVGSDPQNKKHYIKLFGTEVLINHHQGSPLVHVNLDEFKAFVAGDLQALAAAGARGWDF